jgi:hypothetical protein
MAQLTHAEFLAFLACDEMGDLKRSGHYYRDSFKAATHIDRYLPYLASADAYLPCQRSLHAINMLQGDFCAVLQQQQTPFDLIYLSNLLETKACRDPGGVLTLCRSQLSAQGKILLASLDTPIHVDRLLRAHGLQPDKAEIHRFSTLQTILGHYSYSFFLAKPSSPPIHPQHRT